MRMVRLREILELVETEHWEDLWALFRSFGRTTMPSPTVESWLERQLEKLKRRGLVPQTATLRVPATGEQVIQW